MDVHLSILRPHAMATRSILQLIKYQRIGEPGYGGGAAVVETVPAQDGVGGGVPEHAPQHDSQAQEGLRLVCQAPA